MRIRLLGGFWVSVGSRPIEEGDWRLKKAKSLVKLLALAPNHRVHRERIMDALWPELDREDQTNNLRQTRYAARRAFEPVPTASSRYLHLKNEEIALYPDGTLWVDVEVFEEAAATARGDREPAAYRAAIELYSGELLPEDRYEVWAEERREGLQETYLALLLELAGLYEERGEYGRGIEALRRVLSEEPDREEAHTGLMRLYALSGRRRESLRQYERLEEILRRELGEEPGAESRRLRDEILSGGLPPSRPAPEDRLPEGTGSARGLHNLPATRGSFVGRERAVVEVKRSLVMTGLLTLTGAGGSGKTRLALEVAKDLVGLYPDGVWLVELASLSEGALVPQAMAAALGEREQPGRPLTDTLVDAIREKKLLLVLDNCEHLVDASAQLVDTLLSSCPRLQVLATSREPLGVGNEATWQVPPLSVPGLVRLSTAEDIERYEAVRLFVERARLKLPSFEITPANAEAVAEVCRKLDGIPLAIELATARMTALAVEQVAERLDDSLKLLTGGARTADPRHQTMRATLEWSHDLLSEPEHKLFSRFSVFAGGWTLEAAEAVGAGDDVLDLISRLVDQSLVIAEAWADGALRYRMLEPVRQYAREKLEESGEAEQAHKRHAEHYLALAEQAEGELSGSDQALWLDRLETEHDNLRAALQCTLEGEEAELGLRLAAALWLFWYTRGYLSEGREWLEKAASAGGARALHLKARALLGASYLVARQGNLGAAKELLEEALALFRQLEDKEGVASALIMLGITNVLGQQDLETVPALHEEVMNLKPEIQDPRTLGYMLQFSGIIAVAQGDWEQADALHEESLGLFREVRDIAGINASLTNLGLSALVQAKYSKASAMLKENLRVLPTSDKPSIMYNFLGLACAASAQDQPVRAARLWGAAEDLREAFDMQLLPMTRSRLNYDEHVTNARSQLGEAPFEATWAEGKAMTQEEAVRFALIDVEPAPREVPPPVVSGSDEELIRMRARALRDAGNLAARQGDLEAAKELLEEALALFREMEDKEGIGSTLTLLGVVATMGQQDPDAVLALHEEAMSFRPEIKDARADAYLRLFSGIVAVSQGDWERAQALHEESLELFREIRDVPGTNTSLTNLGLIALAKAEYPQASALLKENLRVVPKSDKVSIQYSLFGLACAASAQDQPVRAARLWGAVEAMQEAFGIQLPPLALARTHYDEHLANARSRLGEAVFETAWAEGKAMKEEEAMRFALGDVEPLASETPEPAFSGSDKGLTRMRAEALNRAGYLAIYQDEYGAAKGLLEEALALFRELGDEEGMASSLTYLGLAALAVQKDLETVPALLEEAMSLRSELSDRHTIGMMLIVSGLLAASRGDWSRAIADHEEGLRLFREMSDSQGIVMCITNLGLLAMITGDYERATTLLKENLRISQRLDHRTGIHYSLFGLAGGAARQGQPVRAARFWGAAEAMRETFGIHLSLMARRHLAYDEHLAATRSQLGEAAFAGAWAEGKTMTQEEAIEYALGPDEPARGPAPAGKSSRVLSRREQEVAALVARELTNRQVAQELSISERTVETHVRNVLKKLGLKSRFQLAERFSDADPG